ncbi:MAG TPA: Holliday junction resolvase RuvX [Bacteroidales bacterium]|nr:Holliday junction resolvase RuvX [Bacteroidales bacterium]
MGRILAIDYGQKRVGIAVSDELRICANALDTIHVSKIFDYINAFITQEKVDIIVVGEPKTMNFEPSDSTRYIEPFVNRLKKNFPNILIDRFDERFTSKMAFQTMIDAGVSKKKRSNKELVDKISATIILQSYMQQLEWKAQRNESKTNI